MKEKLIKKTIIIPLTPEVFTALLQGKIVEEIRHDEYQELHLVIRPPSYRQDESLYANQRYHDGYIEGLKQGETNKNTISKLNK